MSTGYEFRRQEWLKLVSAYAGKHGISQAQAIGILDDTETYRQLWQWVEVNQFLTDIADDCGSSKLDTALDLLRETYEYPQVTYGELGEGREPQEVIIGYVCGNCGAQCDAGEQLSHSETCILSPDWKP